MTGYLVLARCHLDDIPMGLYPTEREAEIVAETLDLAAVQTVAAEVFNLAVSSVLCMTVVSFFDTFPVGADIIDRLDMQRGDDIATAD